VRDLVQSGEAVVETERGVVLARFGVPDERVVVSLDEKPGKVQRGRVLSVLSAAPERVEPECPYVVRCGGCPFMHLSLESQRAHKQRFLREALVKAGAPADLELHFTGDTKALGYRRRARLAYRVAGRARELGYRRERSRELVDVGQCAVLEPELNRALAELRERMLPQLAGEGEVSLARGRAGGAVVVLRTEAAQEPAFYAQCEALVADGTLEGLALWIQGTSKPARFGAPEEWTEGPDGEPLEGTLGGFSQAQAEVNRSLVQRVREKARTADARVLELYAGHGNFTLALAGGAASYTAVEQDAAAVEVLRKNLAQRKISAKVVQGDAGKQLTGAALDVVVLDPPRAGAPGVLQALLSRKLKRVVYVSCDTATLARDVAPLLAAGFKLAWTEAFDMFPQTADLESLVVLER
jgi:23S rRNA (uracil1939-C5)-methyltransferase